jgi:DNA-binding IclR family transcriptional regulator
MFSMENDTFTSLNQNGPTPVPAIGKAMRVLEAVGSAPRPTGVSELARRVGFGKSTVHALIASLTAEGLLSPSRDQRGYVLGPRLVELGLLAGDRRLSALAVAGVSRLTEATDETAFFGRLEGDRVRILARQESAKPLKLSAPVGSTLPASAGALGLVHLSLLDETEVNRRLVAYGLARFTDKSTTDPEHYRRRVEKVRNTGFAVERGEYLHGIAAAAAAFSWNDQTYFLWVVGIDAAHADAELESLGAAVAEQSVRLHAELSSSASRPDVASHRGCHESNSPLPQGERGRG